MKFLQILHTRKHHQSTNIKTNKHLSNKRWSKPTKNRASQVMYVLGGLGVLAENGIFTVTDATIALFMFPFSLLFVYVCQNYLGLP